MVLTSLRSRVSNSHADYGFGGNKALLQVLKEQSYKLAVYPIRHRLCYVARNGQRYRRGMKWDFFNLAG